MWTDNELKGRIKETVEWLRDKVSEANAQGVVVGISGGVDSAVVAGLCARAFPGKCIAVVMPSHSDPEAIEDALWVAEGFDLRPLEVNLSDVHTQLFEQVKTGIGSQGSNLVGEKMSQGNLKDRSAYVDAVFCGEQPELLGGGSR